MRALFWKEINGFFSSLTGYVVIIVFLTTTSLFLWVFPGQFNIIESGYANLDPLFMLAPVIFLFLAPAVTMRMFAEEKRTGAIELLLTKPIPDIQIVLAKYLSALSVVLLSLLPTLVYYWSVYLLGQPQGNVDSGGVWGSYIGLFFLAASYVAIGLFASSTTDNQIVSFIIAVLLSFIFYIGFESLSGLEFFRYVDQFLLKLSINEHYRSMSRGVIDTRDVLYFVGVIVFFLYLTRMVIEKRKW